MRPGVVSYSLSMMSSVHSGTRETWKQWIHYSELYHSLSGILDAHLKGSAEGEGEERADLQTFLKACLARACLCAGVWNSMNDYQQDLRWVLWFALGRNRLLLHWFPGDRETPGPPATIMIHPLPTINAGDVLVFKETVSACSKGEIVPMVVISTENTASSKSDVPWV